MLTSKKLSPCARQILNIAKAGMQTKVDAVTSHPII